jgi:hypothetical protein
VHENGFKKIKLKKTPNGRGGSVCKEMGRGREEKSFLSKFVLSFFYLPNLISSPPGFYRIAGSSVPESEIQEYTRKLKRLDMLLDNIEEHIHIAFAALGKEDVVRQMFAMVS